MTLSLKIMLQVSNAEDTTQSVIAMLQIIVYNHVGKNI